MAIMMALIAYVAYVAVVLVGAWIYERNEERGRIAWKY